MSLGVAAAPTPSPPNEPRSRRRGPTGARATRHVYDPACADPRVLVLLGHGAGLGPATKQQEQSRRQRGPRRPSTAPARGAEREELERQKALAATKQQKARSRWRGTLRAAMRVTGRFVAPGLDTDKIPASTRRLAGARIQDACGGCVVTVHSLPYLHGRAVCHCQASESRHGLSRRLTRCENCAVAREAQQSSARSQTRGLISLRARARVRQMILTRKQEEADAAATAAAAEAMQRDEDGDEATGKEAVGTSTANTSSPEPHHTVRPRAAWAYARSLTVRNAAHASVKALTHGILQESLRAEHAVKHQGNEGQVPFDMNVALQETMARRVRDLQMQHGHVSKRLESGGIGGARLSKAAWLQDVLEAQSNSLALFDIRDYRKQTKGIYNTSRHELLGNTLNGHVPRRAERREPLVGGDYELISTEHTTMLLRKRLTSGNATDNKAIEQAFKHVPTSDNSEDPVAMQKAHDTIVALNGLAHSQYTEIQRDAAAAFNSLTMSEDSKPAFVTSDALPTVVHLAQLQDVEILNNIVEAVGRLCQHPLVKRPFVAVGGLKVLHKFSASSTTMAAHALYALMGLCCHDPTRADKLKYAHLKPNADDKLRIVTAEDGYFVRFIFKCTLASTGANARPDPKTRRYAIATLTSLLDGPDNMEEMLRAGALQRFIMLLRSRDSLMRFGAVTALTSLMKLPPAANLPQSVYRKEMREDSCLKAVFAALADALDIALATALLGLVQAVTTHAPDGMSKAKLRKRMIGLGCADVLMKHAVRLLATVEAPVAEPASSSVSNDTGKESPQLILLRTVTATLVELLQGQAALKMFLRSEANHLQTVFSFVKAKDKRICRRGSRLLGRLSTIPEAKLRILEHPSNLPQLLSLATGKLLVDASATVARVLAELAEAWQNRVPLIKFGGVLTTIQALLTTSWEISTKFDCARCLADLAEAVDNREDIASCCIPVLTSLLELKHAGVREQALRCVLNVVTVAGRVAIIRPKTPLSGDSEASFILQDHTPGRYGLKEGVVEYSMASDGEDGEEEEDDGDDEDEDEQQDDEHDEVGISRISRSSGTTESCTVVWRRSIGACAPYTFARLNDVAWWATSDGNQFTTTHNNVTRGRIHKYIMSDSQLMGQILALTRNGNENVAQHASSVMKELVQPGAETNAMTRLTTDSEQAARELVTRRRNEGRQVGFRGPSLRGGSYRGGSFRFGS